MKCFICGSDGVIPEWDRCLFCIAMSENGRSWLLANGYEPDPEKTETEPNWPVYWRKKMALYDSAF